jgi:formylglycine-generating enzyme required for sulfatase activity
MALARLAAWLVLLWLSEVASGAVAGITGQPARIALVIGNGSYTQAPLSNATSDARAVADVLREGGFDVVFAENAQKNEFEASIAAFAQKLERGVIAVVYFSGHAIQHQGRNFLLPLNVQLTSAADVRRETVDVDQILDPMIVARPTASVIILDTGRSNPWQQAISTRVRGLAAEGPIKGVVLVYPAAPGSAVGSGNFFAAELIKTIRIPGLKFEDAFRRIRAAVMRATHDQQSPWKSSLVSNQLVVSPERPLATAAPTRPPDPMERGFWNAIKDSDRAADFKAYIDSYPRSEFADLARARLKELEAATQSRPGGPEAHAAIGRTVEDTPAQYRDCAQCPEMALIPAGTFMMGSEMFDFERPVHKVSIAKDFYIGRREVTFQEWDTCVDDGGCSYRPDDHGLGRGMRPVTDVNWTDTAAYVAWLSRKTGQIYRLPSESEWEYAARAGSSTTYPWGKTVDKDRANCIGCTGDPPKKAVDTGSYPPNAFGLFDMAGNAAEWVQDCWTDTYRGAPADGSAWARPECRERVLRGGSFNNDPRYLRSAARFKYDFDVRYYANGFRVVRER